MHDHEPPLYLLMMLLLRGGRHVFARHLIQRRLYGSNTKKLALAFDLHQPTKEQVDSKQAPIVFMHGLFGSKKNNRSISK